MFSFKQSKWEVNLFHIQRQHFKESPCQRADWGAWGDGTTEPNIFALPVRKGPCAPCQVLQIQLAMTASCCRDEKYIKWNQTLLLVGKAPSEHPAGCTRRSRKPWSVILDYRAAPALQNHTWKSGNLVGNSLHLKVGNQVMESIGHLLSRYSLSLLHCNVFVL